MHLNSCSFPHSNTEVSANKKLTHIYKNILLKSLLTISSFLPSFLPCILCLISLSLCLSSGWYRAVLHRDLLFWVWNKDPGTWFCLSQELLPEKWVECHGLCGGTHRVSGRRHRLYTYYTHTHACTGHTQKCMHISESEGQNRMSDGQNEVIDVMWFKVCLCMCVFMSVLALLLCSNEWPLSILGKAAVRSQSRTAGSQQPG